MTPLAVLFMTVAVGFVVMLAAWCYYRVLFGRHSGQPLPRSGDDGIDPGP